MGICLFRMPFSVCVKAWVADIDIVWVKFCLDIFQSFCKPLIMNDFPGSEKTDDFLYFFVVYKPQDVVIRRPRFLFRCHVLGQVRDRIALGLEVGCRKGNACRRLGIDAQRMIDKISVEPGILDLLHAESVAQLIQDGRNDLDMCELIRCLMLSMIFYHSRVLDLKTPSPK